MAKENGRLSGLSVNTTTGAGDRGTDTEPSIEALVLFQSQQMMELGGLALVQEIGTPAGTTIGQNMEDLA
ncbi:MAG: hypothetical protein QGI86_22880 [Candidatus Poribacteria bacterium]|nr:hypothetical protein [Candidatus Poribacteria bacterium]MDP6994693.1 hypothetical protein [Candidatus Poribacteria bacterium]